jgi:D-glycero-alpha-D-manno-heptose-7-phosphate kinase
MRLIHAAAPIRICDVGGWTDTWFARHGRVLNIAVTPVAEVNLRARTSRAAPPPVRVRAENLGLTYRVTPGARAPGGVPIVDAALAMLPPPEGLACTLSIRCDVPAGASTGTSAAVAVALVGALAHLRGSRVTAADAARLAHRIETEGLGRQSGVQDQICAAHGGINAITIEPYPQWVATRPDVPSDVLRDLERRLVLIYLGHGHESSAIHEAVIRTLADAGPDAPPLVRLRQLTETATAALVAGDLPAFGRTLCENTDAQAALHPMLVSAQARSLIAVAREHGAIGWKVNGAGGDGGTLTLLCDDDPRSRDALVGALGSSDARIRLIPVALDPHGLRVWERPVLEALEP